MAHVLIALGSNIEPAANLQAAVAMLRIEVQLTALSRVYRTPPWGGVQQAPFLNGAAAATTRKAPLELLETLLRLEARRGRERTVANGPRTLDLDLLAYDDLVLDSERLTLPHPRLHERAFVLVPLCDIAPDWRHPRLGRTTRELLAGVDQTGIQPLGWQLGEQVALL